MLKSGAFSMQDWKETINSLTDAITIHDMDFNIIYANPAAERMLQLRSLKNNNVKCYAYYHGTKCPPANCVSCRSLKIKKTTTVEIFEPYLKRFIELRSIPTFNHRKQVTALIHIARDITRRRNVQSEIEDRILANIKTSVSPYIKKLKNINSDPNNLRILNILESNLHDISSSFTIKATSRHFGLTPAEIQVSKLIQDGRQSKEIAELLNISFETVNCHRQNIRKKFGLNNSKTNLRSYLLSLSD